VFKSNFLTDEEAHALVGKFGTPLYVYSRKKLRDQAAIMRVVPAPYGLTIRYAMKANAHPGILKTFKEIGIKIDASSGYEAEEALACGFAGYDILLTSQQLAHNLERLVKKGVQFNATSLRQLEDYGRRFPQTEVSVRINPGIGSGHSAKTNVGGPTSSFGIWHEYIDKAKEIANNHHLAITRLHTHIGSGTDPEVWQQAARMISLQLVKRFPNVEILNLGGGFKVARTDDEQGADMHEIGVRLADELKLFAEETGRQLHLELEPGTFMAANAGLLLAEVDDITDTGSEGYTFLKLNTGMNDILRPSFYGAQHPIHIVTDQQNEEEYVIVGHNCESADLLTPASGQADILGPRRLPKACVGDIVVIGGAGAYCASMATHGYNSFPSARQVLI